MSQQGVALLTTSSCKVDSCHTDRIGIEGEGAKSPIFVLIIMTDKGILRTTEKIWIPVAKLPKYPDFQYNTVEGTIILPCSEDVIPISEIKQGS